jgi:DNA-binding MarR family transcriptional regulator
MTDGNGAPRPGQEMLGVALRRAQAGYRRRVDEELAAVGFTGRRFPDSRVLLMCAEPGEITISDIGRQLEITRQGASKIVAGLRERGYLAVAPSPSDGREKILALTPRALEYLHAIRTAAEVIEANLRDELGGEGLAQFFRVLDLIADGEPILFARGQSPALSALQWQDAEGER